jgi:hypothetical protein
VPKSCLQDHFQSHIFFTIKKTSIMEDLKRITAAKSINVSSWNTMVDVVNGKVNRATDTMTGPLTVKGAIAAGNSDLYFTKADHNHTGLGNAEGNAAIENAADFGALMILGRQVKSRRIVNLYDDVNILQGKLSVGGPLTFGGRVGQHIDLWSNGANAPHGIGVQMSTTYFRSSERFYWYRGGVHDDNPGINSGGGQEIMSLQADGRLLLANGVGSIGRVSDRSLKKNIKPLEKALDKLTQLRGVTFQWKEPKLRGGEGIQTGLIAQEVEQVFPDWIHKYGEHKTIAMPGFDALIIESFRELKSERDILKTTLEALKVEMEKLKTFLHI